MSDDYHDRLITWRIIWFTLMGGVWFLYTVEAGFDGTWIDVTIFLAIITYAGRPRNAAKIYARRALRNASLNNAIEAELDRQRNNQVKKRL